MGMVRIAPKGCLKESRFLANPFLLVCLSDVNAHRVRDSSLPPQEVYPEPVRLGWDRKGKFARVAYIISKFFKEAKYYDYRPLNEFELIAYNARDLGYNYLYIDRWQSKNIKFIFSGSEPILITHYIHRGQSCGYSGGCNNACPGSSFLKVKVLRLPAIAYIKLWRNAPKSKGDIADMVFVIEMI